MRYVAVSVAKTETDKQNDYYLYWRQWMSHASIKEDYN